MKFRHLFHFFLTEAQLETAQKKESSMSYLSGHIKFRIVNELAMNRREWYGKNTAMLLTLTIRLSVIQKLTVLNSPARS